MLSKGVRSGHDLDLIPRTTRAAILRRRPKTGRWDYKTLTKLNLLFPPSESTTTTEHFAMNLPLNTPRALLAGALSLFSLSATQGLAQTKGGWLSGILACMKVSAGLA